MEDLFESLFALLVIVIPLLLKKKDKKKERPGQKKKAPAPKPAHDPDALKRTLREAEKKIDRWLEQMDEAAEEKNAAEPKPAYMQPEPLIPEMLQPERLQEPGMGEGQSHMDDFGCMGGSLPHEPGEPHQGEDFHPQSTHELRPVQRARREETLQVERVKPAVSAADLRRAVIWKEILDAPVSMRE